MGASLARLRTHGMVATMEIIDDVERGAWLGPRMYRLGGWARVGSVTGYGFEAYARILHPRPTGGGAWERRRWSDVATAAGKVMHPLVQWERLLDLDEPRGGTSDVGYLDPQVLAALAPLLGVQTATPDDALAAYWIGGTGQGLVGRSVTIDRYDYVLAQTDTAELAEPGWGRHIGFEPTNHRSCSGRRTTPGYSPPRSTGTPRSSPAPVRSSTRSSPTTASRHTRSTRTPTSPGTATPSTGARTRAPHDHRLPGFRAKTRSC